VVNGVDASVLINNSVTGGSGGKLALLTITDSNVGSLSAAKIVAGQLTVGAGGATAIYIKRSSAYADAFLRWEGGTRIWSDTSNRLGINSIGSPMNIYINSGGDGGAGVPKIAIPASGQVTIYGGAYLKGNLNVADGWTTHLTGQLNIDYDYINLSSQTFRLADMGLTSSKTAENRAKLYWGNGANLMVDATGKWFQINGNAKEAVVPTSEGHKALYCAEAPEVWFFDFCDSKEEIDPMFLEVTEGEMRFIKCDVGYQVWRRRKGHGHKRFEPRTYEQFIKNERFLSLAKI
jgi:hypothetical protein